MGSRHFTMLHLIFSMLLFMSVRCVRNILRKIYWRLLFMSVKYARMRW